jgi:uncharacterized protein YfiM (DUF2279 family)
MRALMQIAAVMSAAAGSPSEPVGPVATAERAAPVTAVAVDAPDPSLREDKYRHAAGSWTAAVFGYAAARSVTDARTALAVALPATAAAGIAKELFDRRAGGPFSLRDLAADAVGAGAAWLLLREIR